MANRNRRRRNRSSASEEEITHAFPITKTELRTKKIGVLKIMATRFGCGPAEDDNSKWLKRDYVRVIHTFSIQPGNQYWGRGVGFQQVEWDIEPERPNIFISDVNESPPPVHHLDENQLMEEMLAHSQHLHRVPRWAIPPRNPNINIDESSDNDEENEENKQMIDNNDEQMNDNNLVEGGGHGDNDENEQNEQNNDNNDEQVEGGGGGDDENIDDSDDENIDDNDDEKDMYQWLDNINNLSEQAKEIIRREGFMELAELFAVPPGDWVAILRLRYADGARLCRAVESALSIVNADDMKNDNNDDEKKEEKKEEKQDEKEGNDDWDWVEDGGGQYAYFGPVSDTDLFIAVLHGIDIILHKCRNISDIPKITHIISNNCRSGIYALVRHHYVRGRGGGFSQPSVVCCYHAIKWLAKYGIAEVDDDDFVEKGRGGHANYTGVCHINLISYAWSGMIPELRIEFIFDLENGYGDNSILRLNKFIVDTGDEEICTAIGIMGDRNPIFGWTSEEHLADYRQSLVQIGGNNNGDNENDNNDNNDNDHDDLLEID